MDNKQNQPNSGTPYSASSSAANKPAAQPATPSVASASTSSTSNTAAASTGRQQATPSSTSTRQSQSQPSSSDTTAATKDSTESKNSSAQVSAPQKSWLDQEQWAKSLDQLPQSLKDIGNKALEQVNGLSTTQKVVGGALLVSGLGWLALRNKNKSTATDTSLHTPKGESKWKASSESVYRGATSTLHNSDDSFSL